MKKILWILLWILIITNLIILPCFAEVIVGEEAEEWQGYKVGDVYVDREGDIGIVVEVYGDGLKYDIELYDESIEDRIKEKIEASLEELSYADQWHKELLIEKWNRARRQY